jgi:chloramphenicol 3-O phosphotransferase
MEHAQIILLNGVSSAGKTTIASALQALIDDPYVHMSLDFVWQQLPQKLTSQDKWWLGLNLDPFVSGFHRAVAGFSQSGVGVIVDHCCTSAKDIEECLTLFSGSKVIFVDVTCSFDELVKRAQTREQRTPRRTEEEWFYFEEFRKNYSYDLQVDTSVLTPQECAAAILKILNEPMRVTAFEQMRNKST